jgi:tetratricopeptide (TPR) repeat protein
MRKYLCYYVFLIPTILFSQQEKLDSLLNVVKNHKKIDTTYVNKRINYSVWMFGLKPSDTAQLDFYLETLKISKALDFKKGIAKSYEFIGVYYQYVSYNPYKALDYYQKAILVADTEASLKVESIKLNTYVGSIHSEMEEFKKAIPYFKKVINQYPSIAAYDQLGSLYSKLVKNDSALYYLKKAVELERKKNHNLYLAHSLSTLAVIQSRIKKPLEATKTIEESINLLDLYGLEMVRTPIYLNASEAYLNNNDLNNAKKYGLKALSSIKTTKNPSLEKDVWNILYKLYKKQKDYEKALKAHSKFVFLKDSLVNNTRKLEVSRKQIQFEADKEKLLAQNEANHQKTLKTIAILTGIILLILALIGFLFFKRKQKSDFLAKVSATELKALQAQMNPHFIFNSLNSINSYILKNDTEAATNYLTKFSKLIRTTLESSTEKEVLLKDDIAILENYLDIEKKRLENSFTYNIIVDDTIDVNNTLIPPLILQPFIENSIWHGIAQMEHSGHIIIEYKKEQNMLFCAVDDNGLGRQKVVKHNKQNTSLGINLTRNRIDIINAQNRTKGSLKIIDKEQGLRVEVKLPIKHAY